MRALLVNRLLQAAISANIGSPFPLLFCWATRYSAAAHEEREEARERESSGVSYGLKWSLAGRGIIVKDKIFQNLTSSELQKHGAATVGPLSGFQILVRGDVLGRSCEISKSQFSKLLKKVTAHISSVENLFVQDGAIGSFKKSGAKVRVISDCPSAALSLSRVLWKIPDRSISRDSSPLIVYSASSISPKIGEIIGLKSEMRNGFVAADIERSSLVLCGRAFADGNSVKAALTALAMPIILARGGLPLSARALLFGESVVLLLASEEIMKSSFFNFVNHLTSAEAGILLSYEGISPFFRKTDADSLTLRENIAALIFCSADSSGVLPEVVKLYPGQAAYHFLAGYQDSKFVPAYFLGPSPISPLDLAKALFLHLKDSGIPSFLVNPYREGKHIPGEDLVKLIQSTLSKKILENWMGPASDPEAGVLKGKYRGFLSGKFRDIPDEFFF